ncbi:hypothetical protein A6V39_03860 [Candidatus Mycoplasma haematobovis]|uniref:Uncharacterized protein n=1 Tax=Candidatus Mycoplasma haematobovis TaxID=432608 RepID=A0A1A9QC35_9MOLU|nr:hypothetical protein [Candidatus Mycoplasma haematobovis]OAL10023.1 hypothetical protein A6V39_03860 [Candidatus Mycoplasma haematobovis]
MDDFIGWTLKWRQYIKDNSENGKPKENDAWGLEDWQTASRDNNRVPSSFADKCNSFQKHKVKGEQDPTFKNYINWCTK